MSTVGNPAFERQQAATLVARLTEPRRFLQVVAGARQVGKTTLVGQVLSRLDIPSVFVSADEPTVGDTAWLAAQWERGRLAAADAGNAGAVLVVDEVQKILAGRRPSSASGTRIRAPVARSRSSCSGRRLS